MRYKTAFKLITQLLLAAVGTVPAFAQWQWLDKDGRQVFSDQSPPADIKEKDIVRRPTARAVPLPPPAALPSATSSPAPPKPVPKETELQARKKQVEKDEAAKKKAEDDKQAKLREDNCTQAKSAMATLQSGVRMAVTNAAGEREVMDDTKRAVEAQRIKDALDSSCKK